MLQQYNIDNKEYISMDDYVFDGTKWVSINDMIDFIELSVWDSTLMDGLDDLEYWNEKEIIN
jgi:hypothetical protein